MAELERKFGRLSLGSTSMTSESTVHPPKILPFEYTELDQEKNEIRLLRILPRSESHDSEFAGISCNIFHANLEETPSYNALSYTWGDALDNQYSIRLNERSFDVRENLWTALLHFEPDIGSEPLIIWIDAICINQDDVSERNWQVGKMTTIYERATEVLVWLGPPSHDSHLAIHVVLELYGHIDDDEWLATRMAERDMPNLLRALADLIKRPYWKRIWVVQELTVAKAISFHCGKDSFNAEALSKVQKFLANVHSSEGVPLQLMVDGEDSQPTDNVDRAYLIYRGVIYIQEWQHTLESGDISFSDCIMYHLGQISSDPKDMVYGLAALANRRSKYKIEVDYSLSVAEVYTNTARAEITFSRKLDILTFAVADEFHTKYNLPSWVPNLFASSSVRRQHYYLQEVPKSTSPFQAAGDSQAEVTFQGSGNIINVKGMRVGQIEHAGSLPDMQHVSDIESAAIAFMSWWPLVNSLVGDRVLIHEAFARVLLRSKQGSSGRKLQAILGAYADLYNEFHPDEAIDNTLASYWNGVITKTARQMHTEPTAEFVHNQRLYWRNWIYTSTGYMSNRRFFISSTTEMGMAPEQAMEGDIVCVLLGCPHPMVLRPVEDHYVVIGEAYYDFNMFGEAMERLEQGELELQDFELH